MSTSCWFAMQLRSPLHHRRQCWYLTWPNINTSKTQHSPIRTRKIDRCQRCVALQCHSNRFATNGTDRAIVCTHSSANGKHKRDIRRTYNSNRSMSTSCCSPAHPQSLWRHRHQYWYLNGIVIAQHVKKAKPQSIPYGKDLSMSKSGWFAMQLRFPLHHLRQ
jgi:hypothetical protein